MSVSLEIEVADEFDVRLNELVAQSFLNKSELFAKALALMDLAITESKKGNQIVIINEQGEVLRQIVGIVNNLD